MAAEMAAHHRHVAGAVEHPVFLLVGRVVLLVDDDQPEIAKRQKKRRARTGDDTNPVFGHLPPNPFAHARRQVGVPFGRLGAESVLEPLKEGMGERDLRQQDQHLPAVADGRRDSLEIDFGLARSGYPVEQADTETALLGHRAQIPTGRDLVAGKIRLLEVGIRVGHHRSRRQDDVLEDTLGPQPLDDARRHTRRPRQSGPGPASAGLGDFQHAPARRGHAIGRALGTHDAVDLRLRIEGRRRAQKHARHHAGRRHRVVRDPGDEAQAFAGERRAVEHRRDRPQLPGVHGAGRLVRDDCGNLARPQRHANDRARHDGHIVGHCIGIGRLRRNRHQHRHDRLAGRILSHGA
jgi:hypothetical protein